MEGEERGGREEKEWEWKGKGEADGPLQWILDTPLTNEMRERNEDGKGGKGVRRGGEFAYRLSGGHDAPARLQSSANCLMMMSSVVLTQYTSETDRQTDTHYSKYRVMHMRRAAKMSQKYLPI